MSTIATESPAPGAAARSEDRRFGMALRIGVAALVLCAAVAAACIVMVPAGEAMVITRFGNPIRVVTEPGLAWKWPAPIESTIPVDLRLRTTSTGLQDVGTSDGLRVLVQAYVAWQVPGDGERVRQFLRSVRNQPDDAARQLRSYVNAALHITSSNFAMTELVNMDAQKVRLDDFEDQVRKQIAPRMLRVYGIDVRQVGVERMTLPDETLAATVQRMKAERQVVAAKRTAEGLQEAAAIRADADKEARELVAKAKEQAADTEADAQKVAARIYGDAYKADPALYSTLRSLDTINQVVGRNTRVVLRTDAAPFRVLVDGPDGLNLPGPATAKASKTVSKAWRETGGKVGAAAAGAAAEHDGKAEEDAATKAAVALERQLGKIAADSAAGSSAVGSSEPAVPGGAAAAPERSDP